MAKTVKVAHHPELTPAGAMEVFQKHFSGKYKVRKIKGTAGRVFMVCKSTFIGVRVRLDQKDGKTSFFCDTDAPNTIAALIFIIVFFIVPAIIIYLIVFKPKMRAMEAEVKSYIENAPEFK